MNILVVSNLFPPHTIGGYEIACEAFVRSFSHDTVTVLTSSYGVSGPEVRDGVIRTLPNVFGDGPTGALAFPHGWRRFFLPEAYATTRHWVAAVRPDLCYVWGLGGLSIAPVAAIRSLRCPLVFHFEDAWLPDTVYHPQPVVQSIKQRLAHPLVAGSDVGAIFVSDFLRRRYAQRQFTFARTTVIPNGIEPLDYPTRTATRAIGDGVRALFVGRIVPDKGLDVLLTALYLAGNDSAVPIALTVAGEGHPDYRRQLQQQAKHLGITVQWLGLVQREGLSGVYAAHDVLVVPSVWDEPFGSVAIEAMAAGIPVVATRSGGLPEIVRPGVTGMLATPGDPASLADALRAFAKDPDLMARLGLGARNDAHVRFTLDRVRSEARRFIDTFEPQGT